MFLAVGGLLIWMWPFSVFVQVSILLHTAAGLAVTPVFAAWQLSHWRATRKSPRRPRKIAAYIGFWLLAASLISGLVLTWQALFNLYASHVWSQIHLWTGVLALPFLIYHVIPVRAESPQGMDSARRRLWLEAALSAACLVALSVLLTGFTEKFAPIPAKPETNIFAPGNVATETGGAIPVSLLANSDTCGVSGCHTAIYEEWRASAHRWSAEDEFFQAVRSAVTEVQGRPVTEKCSGCHDPVSLIAGFKDPTLGARSPGFREGDSCVICHAVSRVDERGIGSYVLRMPRRYLYETSASALGRAVSRLLIRVHPKQHSSDYSLTPLRRPDSCAPCHKEFDVIVEQQGPVQVETQYDDWKHGKWNTDADASKRLYCQQCHMYYRDTPSETTADPYDMRAGLGRKHRNHFFAAGNQFMPAAVNSPDASGQIRRVNQWLQGEQAVPELSKVWPEGPLIGLDINAPEFAGPGAQVHIRIVLTNRKVGHSFPTGPLNIGRAWLELVVRDNSGKEVFHSGGLDKENHIQAGSYVLKPLAIDLHGQMIMENDLWHPKGPIYRPAILAGRSDAYDYQFRAPLDGEGSLTVEARLRYRKANQFFMDSVYTNEHREAPVTDLVVKSGRISMRTGTKPKSD